MNDDYFFSVNRLVEFGLSLAVAQQMVNTMNNAMTNMKTPGTFPNFQAPQKMFYVVIEGAQSGPYDDLGLMQLIRDGKIDRKSFVWYPGLPEWSFAGKIPEVEKLFLLMPPIIPQ